MNSIPPKPPLPAAGREQSGLFRLPERRSEAAPSSQSGQGNEEVRELRARIDQLEQTLQETRLRHLADLKALRHSQHLLNSVLDNSNAVIFAKDTEGRYILVNRRYEQFLGRPRAEILGRTDVELYPAEVAEQMQAADRLVLDGGRPNEGEQRMQRPGGETLTVLLTEFPLFDPSGAVSGLGGIATDISELKRANEERAAFQQKIIEAQRATLHELSTPLIPLAEGVLAVPLIGTIDTERASQIQEVLLTGIAAQRVRAVILDVTGVRVIDAQVASALLRVSRSAQLLGAEVILTGIRAEIAHALVRLGADLGDVVTRSTLQSGIAYAMRR